jgi:hypothetical protein
MLIFYEADERGRGRRRGRVAIDHFWTPSLKISMPEDGEAWIRVTTREKSGREAQGRKLKRIPVHKLVQSHFMLFKLRRESAWIHRLSSFLPMDSSEFHPIVLSLTTMSFP